MCSMCGGAGMFVNVLLLMGRKADKVECAIPKKPPKKHTSWTSSRRKSSDGFTEYQRKKKRVNKRT